MLAYQKKVAEYEQTSIDQEILDKAGMTLEEALKEVADLYGINENELIEKVYDYVEGAEDGDFEPFYIYESYESYGNYFFTDLLMPNTEIDCKVNWGFDWTDAIDFKKLGELASYPDRFVDFENGSLMETE
jgi:hypothetical protein